MEKRVTLKDIALRAGVHYSTVSLALRGDPRLPVETRRQVAKVASSLGYRPDAALSALCAYRNTKRPRTVQSSLAYLTDMNPREPFPAMVFRSAHEQALKLGYNLVQFNLRTKGASLDHFRSVWWNRGIKGVLIGPFDKAGTCLDGPWERWVNVAYGYSVASPDFNRAVQHHFDNMLIQLQALRDRGYQRIGLCLPPSLDDRTHGLLHAAYLWDQIHRGTPPVQARSAQSSENPDVIEEWIRDCRLDALIAHPEQHAMLVRRAWRIPEDLGFALLSLHRHGQTNSCSIASFDTRAELLAANAVNFLVSLLHEQAYGLLVPPRHHMISGEFRDGHSLTRTASATSCPTRVYSKV